jgi:hypothetical protein
VRATPPTCSSIRKRSPSRNGRALSLPCATVAPSKWPSTVAADGRCVIVLWCVTAHDACWSSWHARHAAEPT